MAQPVMVRRGSKMKGRGLWFVGLVCAVVLTMPMATALTLAPLAEGDTDVSNTDCQINLAVPADQNIDIPGSSDTFRLRMGITWYDHRTSGSAAIIHRFAIDATYLATPYQASHEEETTGGMSGPSLPLTFNLDIDVTTSTSMDVVYSVSVRYKSSGTVLCSADNSSEPELTTFTFV